MLAGITQRSLSEKAEYKQPMLYLEDGTNSNEILITESFCMCSKNKKRHPGKLHFTFFFLTKKVSAVIYTEGG